MSRTRVIGTFKGVDVYAEPMLADNAMFTLFADGAVLENTTDDMNSTESWSRSGMVWTSRAEAEKALRYWRGVEDIGVVEIVELQVKRR